MRRILALVGATVLVASPGAAQQASNSRSGLSLEDLTGKLAMVESVADMTSWFGPKPDPIPEFGYSEKRKFDMQLHQSLAANIPVVNIRVDGAFSRDAIPERMSQWLTAVQKSGGNVRYCALEQDRSIIALLGVVLKLTKKADQWLLYKPASAYDALVVSDPTQGKVLNAVFTERGATSGCPDGTQDVGAGASN